MLTYGYHATPVLDRPAVENPLGVIMNKSDIKKAMRQSAKGAEFVTHEQITLFLGCGNDKAYELTGGLMHFKSGRRKLYSVEEVAQRIWNECRY